MKETLNYIIRKCDDFLVKDDGIYHCTEVMTTESGEEISKVQKLIITKQAFIQGFEAWINGKNTR